MAALSGEAPTKAASEAKKGRAETDLVEAPTAEEAVKAAEVANPGYVVFGKPKEEETCE